MRLLCPTVVGRGPELELLGDLLRTTVAGRGNTVFLIGHPEQYARSMAWWFKVGSLALAGLNAAIFESGIGARTVPLPAGVDTPLAAKAVGVVSLIAWFGVLYWGRMLPFIGSAF